MNDRAVLNVHALSDSDRRHVAAHDRVEPEAAQLTDPNLAGDRAVMRDKIIFRGAVEEFHVANFILRDFGKKISRAHFVFTVVLTNRFGILSWSHKNLF